MADCLKCAKCYEVSDGAWVQCGDEGRQGERIPWSRARQSPCDDFEPKPAPAPSPASADREGLDVLDVLREVRDVLLLSDPVGVRAQAITGLPEDPAVAELCERWGYGAVMDSAARQWRRLDSLAAHTTGAAAGTTQKTLAMVDVAIFSEEARRARPDKDQRGATIRAETLLEVAGDLDNRAERARDGAYGSASSVAVLIQGFEQLAEALRARATLALRAAGVEPAHGAQEGKATP